MRLSHKDFDAFQHACLAFHECGDLAAFQRRFPEIIQGIIPFDHFGIQEVRFSRRPTPPKIVWTIDPLNQITAEMARFSAEELLNHPFPKYFVRTGNWTALILSDFLSARQFRRSHIFEGFYRRLGVDRLIGMPNKFGPATVGGMAMGRRGRDFTERDRLLLNLLRPHVELAYRNAIRWTAAMDFLAGPKAPIQSACNALTPRETEIARWLAAGKTNPEIAIILQANVRTVEKHMEKIFVKLGVENRSAAIAVLLRQDEAEGDRTP